MILQIDFIFEYDSFGTTRQGTYTANWDCADFLVQTELEVSGYENVKLIRKEWPRWAWPGGYPIFYVCADGGVLCSKCANDNIKLTTDPDADKQWRIDAADINYENHELYCEHCNERIETAYGEPDDDSMDGDHDSAMTSAGFGTDEDYGHFGGDE